MLTTSPTLVLAVLVACSASAPAHPGQEPESPEAAESPGASGDARMRARLAEVAERAAIDDSYVGLGALPGIEAELEALPEDGQHRRRLELLREAGFHTLRLGRTGEAALLYEQAHELAEELQPDALDAVRLDLALAWLRHGESQNCVARHTSKSCLLPIEGEGVHTDQQGSRRALELLVGMHERRPRDARAAWLTNLAAMTVGEWPEAVPEAWRIPDDTFVSEREFPRFEDVAPERGLASFDLSGGGVVDDFDGDGVLDVLTSTWDPAGGMHLFRGLGGGEFEEITAQAGLEGLYGGLNLVQADYDDDGDLDVLVLRGAWLGRAGRVPNSLLRNDGGRFVDVTFGAGVGRPFAPTQTASFADYDNDGDLDLFVGNESERGFKVPNQLFQNQGDGTFVDVAEELGLSDNAYTKGVTFGDFDGDRWPDLYVSNMGARNQLYRNRKGESFRDVTNKSLMAAPMNSFATWFFDYDNDGRLDLFVASYYPVVDDVARRYLGWTTPIAGPELYRQQADGGFKPIGKRLGVGGAAIVMGSNFGDLDGDGWLDIYLGTGYPGFEALMPNVLYANDRGKGFTDVTAAGGLGHLQKGHGVSFADLDGDGDVDLHAQMGGAFPGDAFGNALFQNPGFGNAWITVQLRGEQSNHFGVGARIHCRVTEDGQQRSIYRHVNSGGSFGCNPVTQTHIGLGKTEVIDVLEVYWPTSDTTQAFESVPVGGTVRVREGAEELERL